ncbi:RagB/SusD family nutrient uptake outer membrane protein [Fodinibius salsisoli]|uniref:RagB/SusD family nutrient uptake outer membrane protein n=1 Tax=Fodinibius salsisoli TaxID=2820877 RepID=A0ABT3PQ55_9BACT|nr:RagB/SusD family nutrient uptake outer membrane protein [Fodinibius salsisoli]MCW9707989.1 RagB/SusD family nutrient uptake outer membrane protein [Fodinibius salsisoli]
MKRIYIVSVILLMSISILSCNDGFMTRAPLDEVSDENFWRTAQDMELYTNTFYQTYIRGHGYSWAAGRVQPYGVNEGLAYRDVLSDNAAPESYLGITNNEYDSYNSGSSVGWSWDDIRSLNYFLANYKRGNVDPADRNIYLGEVLFFKAWAYYKKVKIFGAVPWLSKPLNVDSPELMGERDPREAVMDSVLNILDQSIEYLPAKGEEKAGRIHKDVALALKSRIGLFEGTYRKYHTDLGLDETKFLQASVEASERLMTEGSYAIYSTGDTQSDYYDLFSTYSYSDNPEIIFWKDYSTESGLGHAFARYWAQNLRHRFGATRSLVETYLASDGKPISVSPVFEGKDSIQQEMTNRDPRLTQTIANFGEYNLTEGAMGANNAPVPNIPGLSGNTCPTGFRVAKWYMNDPAEWDRVYNGIQAAPVFRYAEVLLNYAEAKYELGQITQSDIDRTINAIRDRVDMPHLMMGNVPDDPALDSQYSQYVGYVPDPLLREIRRERRVELAFEGFRWDDLMRWKAGGFLEKPVEGIKFVQEQFPSVVTGSDVFLSEEGFIRPYAETLPNGREFDERQYLFPLPTEQLVLNPNLDQNPGYDSP